MIHSMKEHCAYWNPNRLSWEILLDQPAGDRLEKVAMHIETAHKILKTQGVKFIPAKYSLGAVVHLMIIIDYDYWIDNEQGITEWCKESDIRYTREGMALTFKSEEEKLLFTLRWA